MSDNLVKNPAFLGAPDNWEFVTPRDEIATGHSVRDGANGRGLVLSANGDKHAFSWWRGEADMQIGHWYRASVRVKTRNIANPANSVFVEIGQHLLLPREPWAEETVLEQVFPVLTDYEGNKVELYLKASETGEVEYYDPQVERVPKPRHRIVRVATTRFGVSPPALSADAARVWNGGPDAPLTLEGQRARISDMLDQAGKLRPDIVCLTEFSHTCGVDPKLIPDVYSTAEEAPDGPTCRVISAKAKEYGMYVIAGLVIKDGKHIYNTAVLFDRQGDVIGQYRKTHPMFGELKLGISCGDSYPVFDLDFGRIAMHICYDEWIPEVSRYYAHRGAEILFLPVAGGKPITWRTRALDNGVYFVSSSINPPSMIINSSGDVIAQTHGQGVVYADLNLDFRPTNWYGDPTLSYGMPCTIPQMRIAVDDHLVEELGRKLREAWR
ncbi:MAG: carbon-nitrogen hydrolase family protein [Armatimonadota bacterium]|nr:carbon-nitrogen hydrolase family protein [Armatimonadota bacterium]